MSIFVRRFLVLIFVHSASLVDLLSRDSRHALDNAIPLE
jgi:hypothetical protein